MTAFRLFDPFQTFTDQHGQLNASGHLVFFASGTTTPQNVYADQALTVNLGNSVEIGTDGRPVSDIWGSGNYRARLLDVNGVQIGPDRDNVQIPGGSGAALPTPFVPEGFLSNDGSVASWTAILQLPDPTGQNGKIIGSDGAVAIWETLSSLGLPTITADSAINLRIGAMRLQVGTAIIPNSGASTATVNVGFSTAFSGPPNFVGVMQTDGSGVTSGGKMLILSAQSQSASGFMIGADINAQSGNPPISRTTNVQWLAIGPA